MYSYKYITDKSITHKMCFCSNKSITLAKQHILVLSFMFLFHQLTLPQPSPIEFKVTIYQSIIREQDSLYGRLFW